MAEHDWHRAKELLAEALELDPAERQTFVQRLLKQDTALGREVETLLDAHTSAEGAGFLDGPLLAEESMADDPLAEESVAERHASDATLGPAPAPTAEESDAGSNANTDTSGGADATYGDQANPESTEQTLLDPSTQRKTFGEDDLDPDERRGSGDATIAYTKQDPAVTPDDLTLMADDAPSAPSSVGDRIGADPKFIADDYELFDELGVGGMGVVYRAFQHSLRRHVALKIIPTRLLRSGEQVARFYLEAEAAGGLDHPGIVPVQDVGESNGVHYYAMALVEGGSLAQYVGAGDRLPAERIAELIEQVSHAVQYAHDHAVIHRDIKPANIMLDKQGRPRLCDFGLAKVMDADDGLTVTGQVMGTPSYMAPEQAQGKSHAITNRTDVYALGATMYALLSGKPPFTADTLFGTLQMVQNATPAPLAESTPLDLRTICEKCLAKEPGARYQSAAALANDLRRYLDGYPISARPVAPWQRVARWVRRNPLIATMVGAIATTLLLSTVVSTWFGVEASRQAANATRALQQSEENAQRLSQAIEETFIFASEDLLAEEPGMQAARQTLLENAQRYYQELIATGQGSEDKLASAAFMLGRVQASLGQFERASASFKQSLSLQARALAEQPSDAAMLTAIARTHTEYARMGKAIWHGQESNPNSAVARDALADWIEHARASAEHRAAAVASQPDDRELKRLHANALMNLGLAEYEQAKASGDRELEEQIEKLLHDAQAIRQKLLAGDPASDADVALVQRDFALGLVALADFRSLEGEWSKEQAPAEAVDLWRESLALRTQAADQLASLPSASRTQNIEWNLATCHQARGESHVALGEINEALAAYKQMYGVMARLLLRNPNVGRFRRGVADAQFWLAQLTYVAGNSDGGGEYFAQCQDTLIEGVTINPRSPSLTRLVDYTGSIASSLAGQAMDDRALGFLDRAVELLEGLNAGEHQQAIDAAKSKLEDLATKLREKAAVDRGA